MRQPVYDTTFGRWKIPINTADFLICREAGEMVGDVYVSQGTDYLISDIVDMILQSQAEVKELEADNQRLRDMWAKAVSDLSKIAADNHVGGKWIPVTEMLPEKDGRYLVRKKVFNSFWYEVLGFARDGREVDEYDFQQEWENVWYQYDSEYGYFSLDSVTHWMPLPEPPKEG